MALCATSSYYDTMEIATRIFPSIVVLTIDPDSDVRSKAFQAVDQFLQIVKQHDEKINSGDTTGTSGIGMSAGNAGLLGWAMSSLTIKGKADQAPVASAESSSQLTTAASNASSVVDLPDAMPAYPTFTTDSGDIPAPSSPTSTDGWGEIENGIFEEQDNDEKDKWDDVEPLEEPKPAAFANIQAAQKRPIVQPKSQVTSVKPKSTARVAKDEDEDLRGSIAAPAPKSMASTSLNIRASSSSLNMRVSSSKADDDDPWAAIAAPAPTTRAKPLSLVRGRGTKPAAPKLGAQRVNRTSSGGI